MQREMETGTFEKTNNKKRGLWPRTKQQPGGGGGDSANQPCFSRMGFLSPLYVVWLCVFFFVFFSEMYQFCFGFSVYFTSEWKQE